MRMMMTNMVLMLAALVACDCEATMSGPSEMFVDGMVPDTAFDAASDIAVEDLGTAQVDAAADADSQLSKPRFGSMRLVEDLPDRWRSAFGREAGQTHIAPKKTFATIRTVDSTSSFMEAYGASAAGDAILIEDGSTISVTLSESRPGVSDTPEGKIYIIGSSDSSGRGEVTLASGSSLNIDGADHVAIGHIKFAEGRGMRVTRGIGTWIYDNYTFGGTFVLRTESGSRDTPTILNTRIVNNYFNGTYEGNNGVVLVSPYTNPNRSTPFDTVIAANTFENFQDGRDYEAIAAVSWGWNHPESRVFAQEPDNYVFVESNHFINCGDEVVGSKIRRYRISRNLLSYTDDFDGGPGGTPGFISLRSGDDKIVDGNIVLNNSRYNNTTKAIEVNGANHHGYFNYFVRGSNAGLAIYYGRQSTAQDDGLGVRFNNMPVKNNVWRYNFWGDNVSSWIRIKDGNVADQYTPEGNLVADNFYAAEDTPRFRSDADMSEAEWDNANPGSSAADQFFGTPSGDVHVLNRPGEIPNEVVVRGWGIDGADVRVECPPWIGVGNDMVVTLIPE